MMNNILSLYITDIDKMVLLLVELKGHFILPNVKFAYIVSLQVWGIAYLECRLPTLGRPSLLPRLL